jgi:hypothetical protein
MTRSTALLGFGCVLAACGTPDGGGRSELPDLELSTLNLDFGDVNTGEPVTRDITIRNNGELPMGLSQIVVAPDGDKAQDYEKNFAVTYDFAEMMCDDGSGGGDTTGDPKDVSTDGTKKPKDTGPKDSGDDTGFYDTGDTGDKVIVQQVLNPGCELPLHVTMDPVGLGEVQAGLLIITRDEPSDREPNYYRDPDEEYKIVKLEGNAVDVNGRILVEPRNLEFGFVWAGEVGIQYVLVRNDGRGDLVIDSVQMAENCPESQLSSPAADPTSPDYINDLVLEPGESISIVAYHKPLTAADVTGDPTCNMHIHSDDPREPDAEVEIKANQKGLSEDTPPSVRLISPAPGHVVNSGMLTVEVDMWDANQPADSLDCYIRSAMLKMAGIADCVPSGKSGHVIVQIPAANTLEAGTDTIEVIVTDAHGQRAVASTTILYLTSLPENDADGDGYVDHVDGGNDCNDNDATIYPAAAELPDGKDNNCEDAPACVPVPCFGTVIDPCIDEGTVLGDDDADCFVERCSPEIANGCDCNDWETYGAGTFPDAPEVPDGMDNDCDPDGSIDEGTNAYDDDNDGYDEFNGDFDDADPLINPAAVEYCDGIDNDCDNIIDDAGACIPIDSRPVILGGAQGVWADKTDIGTNESTTIGVYGFDADGDTLTYVWTQDDELAPFVSISTSAAGPVVTFTAPDEVRNGADEYRYDVGVQVNDDDGNSTWAFGYVWVHDGPVELTISSGDNGGCNKNENQAFAPLLPLALLAWASRRRRSRAA